MKERLWTLCLLALVFGPSIAAAQTIDAIAIEGNRRVDDSTVMLQVKSAVGSPLDSQTVSADIKDIYKTGFFDKVEARSEIRGGKQTLVFDLKEKPAIRSAQVEGNEEVSDSTLREQLSIGSRRFLDRKKLLAGVEQARAYYQSQGYYDTEINYEVKPVDDETVDLVYRIKEGEKKVIRDIAFEGLEAIDESDLEDVIKTDTYFWLTSWFSGAGTLKKDQLEADVREINSYLLNHGYVDGRAGTPEVQETEKGLKIVFRVTEGEQYNFGDLAAEGTLLEGSESKTLEGIEAQTGETFDASKLRKDAFSISDKFTDIGFAFANVEPQTKVNRAEKTVDVTYEVDKGQLVHVNRINISGNSKTSDNVIRREFQIQERDLFSSSRIRRSQQLLQRLGYFEEVTISPASTNRADEVDLNVAIREANTGTFSIGAGVSSGEGFIASAQVTESNIFGTGNAITFNVDSGTRNENYILGFTNPRVNDSYFSFGAEALSTTREFDDFDRNQAGGSLSVGYPLAFLGEEIRDDYRATLRYELLRIDISEIDDDAPQLIIDEEGRSTSSSITPALTRNTIDNPLDPTNGSRQQASVELAGLGGTEEFWLLQLSNSWYYPVIESERGPLVFAQRTRFGYGDTYNDERFPLFRRFFPGGINSVRGFDARELGPKDEQGNEYGGNKQLVLNFEMIFPVLPSVGLQGVAFYDIGNAFDDEEQIEASALRHAVGWGIRWRSPIAPIRIEFGYPLDREEGEKSFVTNFSFGSPL